MGDKMEFKILTGALSWFLLELSLLEETVESVETSIAAEIERMDEGLQALRPCLDAEWEAEDSQDIENEFRDPSDLEIRYSDLDQARWAQDRHATILRSALFLATYAAFEQCLDGLANEWRETLALDLRQADLRHQGIERSKAYLTKVVKMPFPSDSPDWGRICHLRAIRNQLAHDGPELSEKPGPKLRAAFVAFPGVCAGDTPRISLTAHSLREVFRTLNAFTQTLIARNEAFSNQGPTLVE
jgi:hypothetical protein